MEHRTIEINYDQLKDVIVAHLYAIGALNDNEDVLDIDIPVHVSDDDLITLELEIALRFTRRHT